MNELLEENTGCHSSPFVVSESGIDCRSELLAASVLVVAVAVATVASAISPGAQLFVYVVY